MGRKVGMLAFLSVKGFAIIDELGVDFEDGFNVITGETGAGKSIIINALSTLLNAKASPDMVRSSSRHAEVSGHFIDGDREFILRRVINPSGRSRAYVNNEPVTLAKLEKVGETFLNIYGQNEFQHLLDKSRYINLLDDLLSLGEKRLTLAEKVKRLRELNGRLSARKKEADGKDRETALLEFQIDEIERAHLKDGEEHHIRERLKILKEAEKIRTCLGEISENLYEGDISVYTMLGKFISSLRPFTDIDLMSTLKAKLDAISIEVEDVLLLIKDVEREFTADPEEIFHMEDRLSTIFNLRDKYGKTIHDIRLFTDRCRERLAYLETLASDMEEMEKERADLEKEIHGIASDLSEKRKAKATDIEALVVSELGFLSMEGIQFKVSISDRGFIDEDGRDDVDLLISTNPGEPLRPLRNVASGGELSRIMLAVKRVIGGEEEKTLVFDEVDAGIGGRVAELVGKRLRDLSINHQVICITHLPQIAAYGNHHFLVEKTHKEDVTQTGMKKLSKNERVAELARMLGGLTVTDITIQKAREMLNYD